MFSFGQKLSRQFLRVLPPFSPADPSRIGLVWVHHSSAEKARSLVSLFRFRPEKLSIHFSFALETTLACVKGSDLRTCSLDAA